MRSVPMILLFALVGWAPPFKVLAADISTDGPDSVPSGTDNLIGRLVQPFSLEHTDLNDAALGKSARLAVPFHRPLSLGRVTLGHNAKSKRSLAAEATRGQLMPVRQLLEFTEPETNVGVKLVGVMHYNPASIQLAKDTIDDLGEDGKLGSVIVESCDIRWNSFQKMNPAIQRTLRSEMRAACDAAVSYDRPVVLGDQRVNVTVSSMKSALQETFSDLAFPVVGWWRIAQNLAKTLEETALLGGENYMGAFALFDPRLLPGYPEAIGKYLLAYLVKLPVQTISLVGLLLFVDSAALPQEDLTWTEGLQSFGLSTLTTVVFARILLNALLQERNEILANSILEQCRLYQKKDGLLDGLFSPRRPSPNIVYAPESTFGKTNAKTDKTVVAVLGMAHCNGVMKLLKEQQVT